MQISLDIQFEKQISFDWRKKRRSYQNPAFVFLFYGPCIPNIFFMRAHIVFKDDRNRYVFLRTPPRS